MKKSSSAVARLLAALALIVAAVAVVAVLAGAVGDSGSSSTSHHGRRHSHHRHRTTAAVYVVKSGDTLVAIAHRTGIPVRRIVELNPEADPQILIAGEKLKLR